MATCSVQSFNSNNSNRSRIDVLSQPKPIRSVWYNTIGSNVAWGTQEVIRPISRSACKATPTARVSDLARPKTDQQTSDYKNRNFYSCGRSSVIWDVSPYAKKAECTGRIEELQQPKQPPKDYRENRPHFVFSCGRSSPIWNVDDNARSASARPRTNTLAESKRLPQDFKNSRPIISIVTEGAKNASASECVVSLSAHKRRQTAPYRDPQWEVTPQARSATATSRCLTLSKSKALSENYQTPRAVVWDVSKSAQRAKPTQRVTELSVPIIRKTMDETQFDPNAFQVKENALKAHCSRRLEELSVPITR